jgi:hypothetical protein
MDSREGRGAGSANNRGTEGFDDTRILTCPARTFPTQAAHSRLFHEFPQSKINAAHFLEKYLTRNPQLIARTETKHRAEPGA